MLCRIVSSDFVKRKVMIKNCYLITIIQKEFITKTQKNREQWNRTCYTNIVVHLLSIRLVSKLQFSLIMKTEMQQKKDRLINLIMRTVLISLIKAHPLWDAPTRSFTKGDNNAFFVHI